MYFNRIVQIVYEALWDLPVCVSIVWQLYGICGQGTVQIRAEGVGKCRLEQSGPHGVVKCHTRSWIRTCNLRGTTGPPVCVSSLLQLYGICGQEAL